MTEKQAQAALAALMNILAGKRIVDAMKENDGGKKLADGSGVKVQVEVSPTMLPVFKVTKC